MKKHLQTLVLLWLMSFTVIYKNVYAQAPSWAWAKSAGGTFIDYGWGCATDINGNVYITGYFNSSTITFGSTTLNNTNTNSDIFIVKYDPSGNVLWAKNAGGIDNDVGRSCATDGSGNVYVTGYFNSSSITFGSTTLTNASTSSDIFIVKYDPNGNVLWAQREGGTFSEWGYSCASDASGNVYVTGYFNSSSITFGSTVLTNANAGVADIFIVKYDSSGTILWAQRAGDIGIDYGWSCTTDVSGNVYLTGYFLSASITFGTTTLNNISTGSADIFIVKYDSSGTILWAQRAGGTNEDRGYSTATDVSGNLYVTGFFRSFTITFGSTTLTNANTGNDDIFIVKYDSIGTVLWAERAGGFADDIGYSTTTDAGGNVYITGEFQSSSITFGSTTLTNTNIGYTDVFIANYDMNGNVLWAKNAGGTGNDGGRSCATDASGNVYVTGTFYSLSIAFGSTTLTNANTINSDIFTAKLDIVTGVEENISSTKINVFPNPFSMQTVLKTDNPLRNATLTVDNCFGQTVAQIKNISGQTIVLSRDNLASGLYFVRLTQDSKLIATKKLIITD